MPAGSIRNLAFYRFFSIDLPDELKRLLEEEATRLGLKGTVLISHEGINCMLSGGSDALDSWIRFLRERGLLPEVLEIKESWTETHPFDRLFIKVKKEIISMGLDRAEARLDPAQRTGRRLSALELKKWLDEKKPLRLVDVRNDYEIRIGSFKGALDLGLRTFREFPERLRASQKTLSGNEPVVMFCTGGIRCEKATALALELGLEEDRIYQLEGGILRYFEEAGGSHYQGSCFVFDQRGALDPNLKPSRSLVQCIHCKSFIEKEISSGRVDCPVCPVKENG